MKNENANLPDSVEPTANAANGMGTKWLGGMVSALASILAFKCPACIPALAAILSTVGLGSIGNGPVVRWLTIAFLATGVVSLGWSARMHRRWWILATGILGALMIYLGRYAWFSPALLWAGTAILLGSAAMNLTIKRVCPRCAQAAEAGKISNPQSN